MTTRRESMENMGTNDKTREKKAGNRVLKAGNWKLPFEGTFFLYNPNFHKASDNAGLWKVQRFSFL